MAQVQVTEEQIDVWKKDHQEVYLLELEGGQKAYLRSPKMLDWRRAFNGLQRDGEIGYTEQLLGAVWLSGDEEIRKSDESFLSAKKQLDKMLIYSDADVREEGDHFVITVLDKTCKVKKVTRQHLKVAESKNPDQKAFATQEKLFEMIKVEADVEFEDRNDPNFRFPLYKALDSLQTRKYSSLKKL